MAPAASIPNLRHLELFPDHERLEQLLFEGVPEVKRGVLRPPLEPGNGFRLRPTLEPFRTP